MLKFLKPSSVSISFSCILVKLCQPISLSIAQADGFLAVERVAVEASHRGLLCDKTVFQYIQKWLGVEQRVSKHVKSSRVVDASD